MPEPAGIARDAAFPAMSGEEWDEGIHTNLDSFSTDAGGFRHSTFKGKQMSVSDCLANGRYGIVLQSPR